MVWMTRYVERRSFFTKRICLQVQDRHDSKWRWANAKDVQTLDENQKYKWSLNSCDRIIPVGTRVRANSRAGFHRGAEGSVVFQEPAGGKLWVQRDGAMGPCYYWNDELDIIKTFRLKKA